ncbi:MAG: amidohydrolase family protein [Acidobacteriota bacterium]
MKTKRFLTLALALTMAISATLVVPPWRGTATVPADEAIAIRGGTVVTVSGATIPKGTVVIRGGLIVAVGADVPVPADARVIDATGMMVYPGLIDSYTSLGLPAPAAPAFGGRGGGGAPVIATQIAVPQQGAAAAAPAPTPTPSGQSPELMASDLLKVSADTFDAQRSAGITTALTAPRDGLFQGQSAFINLGGNAGTGGNDPEKLIIKSPATLNIGFTPSRGGGFPSSLMGGYAFLRQALLDAQHYRDEWSRYNKNKRGVERPQQDKSLAALQPVISGELPVVLVANNAREIRRVISFAEEFQLKYLIAGATQAYEVADLLKAKNTRVLLSLNFPQRPTNIEDPESESLRVLKERADAPKAALALHKAGVRFAFQSGGLTRPQDFLANAARAIEAGLPKEEALKALTVYPAEIFGASDQLGSLETGKIANVIVTSSDLFDRRMQVKYVFIDGRQFEVKLPAPAAGGQPGGRGPGGRGGPGGPGGGAATPGIATGGWMVTVASLGGIQITLNLQQQGTSLTGNVVSPYGTAQLSDGQVSGNDITFNYTAEFQGNQTPVSGRGTIDGNSMRGTLTLMGQQAEFTGTRTPRSN